MFHFVARSAAGLLFNDAIEGRALWTRVGALPGLVCACLMPDHVHVVLHHADPSRRLGQVMSGFARWRNASRGERGRVWAARPPGERLPDTLHLQRTVRYVHLNPCRGGLVDDPLAWPFSTHRDALGFAAPAVIPPRRDAEAFHAYVSGDPSASLSGTPFPHGTFGRLGWEEVLEGVAGVCRVTREEVTERHDARRLLVQTAWVHEVASAPQLAARVGLGRTRVWQLVHALPGRGGRFADPALAACVAAVADPRFAPLGTRDLRRDPRVAAYRSRRRGPRDAS